MRCDGAMDLEAPLLEGGGELAGQLVSPLALVELFVFFEYLEISGIAEFFLSFSW